MSSLVTNQQIKPVLLVEQHLNVVQANRDASSRMPRVEAVRYVDFRVGIGRGGGTISVVLPAVTLSCRMSAWEGSASCTTDKLYAMS